MVTCPRGALGIGLACVLLFAAAPALAEAPPECPTWFPDFRCDRDARFEGFSPPSTAPYLFEDPFITTGLSTWGVWNDFPGRSLFRGGKAYALSGQLRLALTDRIGLFATKDGLVHMAPDAFDREKGYYNLAFGVKAAAFVDVENRFIVTPMLRYEATNGSRDVFAGNGQGIWIPGVSVGWGPGPLHLLGSVNYQIPVDGSENSNLLSYHLHADVRLIERIAPFVEMNGYHYYDDGNGSAFGTGGFEGIDLLNLGSDGVNGNDVITWAVGLRAELFDGVSLGFGFERPLTQRKDIIQQRYTVNLLFEL